MKNKHKNLGATILFVMLLCQTGLGFPKVVHPVSETNIEKKSIISPSCSQLLSQEISIPSIKEIQSKIERKLKFKERIALRIMKRKIKKALKKSKGKEKLSKKQPPLGFIFDWNGFFLGLFLGPIGILIAHLGVKYKPKRQSSYLGCGVSAIILIILVLTGVATCTVS